MALILLHVPICCQEVWWPFPRWCFSCSFIAASVSTIAASTTADPIGGHLDFVIRTFFVMTVPNNRSFCFNRFLTSTAMRFLRRIPQKALCTYVLHAKTNIENGATIINRKAKTKVHFSPKTSQIHTTQNRYGIWGSCKKLERKQDKAHERIYSKTKPRA